jgi:hypothetical protein
VGSGVHVGGIGHGVAGQHFAGARGRFDHHRGFFGFGGGDYGYYDYGCGYGYPYYSYNNYPYGCYPSDY